jgi:hypothetical protein
MKRRIGKMEGKNQRLVNLTNNLSFRSEAEAIDFLLWFFVTKHPATFDKSFDLVQEYRKLKRVIN